MNGPEQHDEQIDQFEQQLIRAMRHAEPAPGFADAIMRRAASDARPPARVLNMPTRWRTLQTWAAGAVAAALLVGVGVQQHLHHRQERNEATRQFEMATQIEQQALDRTRDKLSRSGISLEPQ